MINRPAIVTTRPVLYGEISKVIALDSKVILEESSIPANHMPPQLTYAELEKALSSGDCVEWIYYGNELAGYYWFERKPSYLYIAGIVIQRPFQGKGLSTRILHAAHQKAQDWQVSACRLAVHPVNGPALSAYFKQQYYIVSCVQDFFGPAFPNSFRCIMEKNLTLVPDENTVQTLNIACDDYHALKKATDDNWLGVGLMRSADSDNYKNCVIFKSKQNATVSVIPDKRRPSFSKE